METLNWFQLFTQPMDRAEVVHALSYDIELSWKNTPGKFKLVKLIQKSTFPKISITYVPARRPPNIPKAV